MRSVDDVYNVHVLMWKLRTESDVTLLQSAVPINSKSLRKAILSTSPAEALKVVRLEYSSPGLSDFLGIGKVMEEFNKFIFGVCDRFRDNPMRRVELKQKEFELNAKARRAARKDEEHRFNMERKRHENRRIGADADLKELRSFQALYEIASKSTNPGELDRLTAILIRRGNGLGKLVAAGKITGVQEIAAEENSLSGSGR